MEQILFVNACPRRGSRSLELAQHVLSKLNGTVEEVRLFEANIPPLDESGMNKRDAAVRAGDWDAPILRWAKQFAQADTVVVAAPYWDLLFPTVLRAYFEATTVTGVTFRYNEQGMPESLCRAKRLIYVTTAGGPIMNYNFGYDYVSALAQLYYGIPDVRCFSAEMLDIIGADVPAIMADAKAAIDKELGE